MTLGQFTEPKLLIPRLLGDRREGVIHELTKRLESTGRVESAAGLAETILKREEALPTMAENGIVFPHARGQAVRTFSLGVGLSSPGVRWGAGRNDFVRSVFLCAVPLSDSHLYLSVLSTLSTFLLDDLAFRRFSACSQPEEMFQMLNSIHVISRSHRTRRPHRT
jgi:PTS system fructose-specific IIA component